MDKDIKYVLFSVSFVLVALMSIFFIPLVSATSATAPSSPITVQQGGEFLLRGTITFDQPDTGYFIWGPVYWYDNASGYNNPLDNFQLENTPSVYWSDGSPVENITIDNYAIPNGWQVYIADNGDGIARNGTFTIDIWLRAASPNGTPHKVGSQNIYFAMNRITLWEPDQVTQSAGPIVVNVTAWTGGVVVRGKENCYAANNTGPPPYYLYTKGENAIIAAAQRVDNGGVFAAGWITSTAYDRWKAAASPSGAYMDVMLHSAMQWMVPGADNVLWYCGHNASFFANARATPVSPIDNLLRVYLPNLGYTVDNENAIPITAAMLAGRDIVILANLDNGTVANGGDPSTLFDSEVSAIENFVRAGGGLIVLDGGDYSGTGRYNMYHISNKVLNKLGFNWRFQSDTLNDNAKDNYGGVTYTFRARVLTDTAIGGGYLCGTGGSDNINEYSPCSLIETPTWSVDVVSILPSPQSGVSPATLTYTVTIQNTGTAWDNYDISVTGTDNVNFTRSLNKTKLYLAAGATDNTVIVEENILDNTPYCTWDNLTVTVTGTENSGGTQATDTATSKAHSLGVPARGVDVSISPKSKSGIRENVHFYITVKNTGNVIDNYTLAIENIDNAEWPVAFSDENITLDNRVENVPVGENKVVRLTVTIPDNATPGVGNKIWVKATSQGDNTKSDNDNCVAYAGIFGVQVLISPSEASGAPGSYLTYTVTVINTGNIVDNYLLTKGDSLGWNPTLDNENFYNVGPDESKQTTLRVSISSGAAHCTRDNVWVMATSQGDNTKKDNKSCIAHAVITPVIIRGVRVSISPSSQEGLPDVTLSYTVTVTNTGEATDNFDLRVSGGAGWSPGISPNSLTLAAGASGTATLTVTVPSGAAGGDSTTIVVTATSRADPSASGSTSCKATASAPPAGPGVPPPAVETPGLAIAVMVAAIAAIVISLGYILLKP